MSEAGKLKLKPEKKTGIISLTDDFDLALEQVKKAVLADELVIYPTDTLYGLGGNALSEKAVEKVRKAKGREERKPLSVLVANLAMIKQYFFVSAAEEKIICQHLPGPYTFLLRPKKKMLVSQEEKVGVRVPEHFFITTVSKQLGIPIITTSANLSGAEAPVSLKQVPLRIRKAAAVIVDGGECRYALGSTVVDLETGKILRQGAGRFCGR